MTPRETTLKVGRIKVSAKIVLAFNFEIRDFQLNFRVYFCSYGDFRCLRQPADLSQPMAVGAIDISKGLYIYIYTYGIYIIWSAPRGAA